MLGGYIMQNYVSTIQRVQGLLVQNPEWLDRYTGYIEKLSAIQGQLQEAQKQFYVPAPFQLYLSLSMATKCNSRSTFFELRFHGRSVAELAVSNQEKKKVKLYVKNVPAVFRALDAAQMYTQAKQLQECVERKKIDWHDKDAQQFRKLYSELEDKVKFNTSLLPGQPEHDMESLLLQNYAQKRSEGKELLYIQPVVMRGTSARFQMPTPLRASNAKSGAKEIEYAGQYGGGIDILARMGRGYNATLAIMELKDENKKPEPPEKAICQAIAYATFIHTLLRSSCGVDWWHFFGFSGDIPKKLNLKAIIVMPNEQGAATCFGGTQLLLDENGDKITLGYIYRENNGMKQNIFIG